MIFDDVLNWAPDNEYVFDELLGCIQKRSVIPFVGAGMSVPMFPVWRNVLDQLIGRLSLETNRKKVYDILDSLDEKDAYTKAADKLIELRSENNVFKDLLRVFNEDRINDDALKKMTVFILPFLFPDMPAVTTNYDRVLEHVYRKRGVQFDSVFGPDPGFVSRAKQQNLHCLFKIHGDIGKETIDGKNLILSGKSYDKVYKPNSKLVRTLKSLYQGKMMLFLGSSLKYDRTIEILKQVTGTETLDYFAIMPCRKEDIDKEYAFFGERRIRTIFYDPDHHESVKIILEELLRKTDPEGLSLFRSFSEEKKIEDTGNPFVYSSDVIGFYGRDQEMEELRKFVEAENDFSWWAVTGEGGAGKTRLVYEFAKKMRSDGWNDEWIDRDDLKDINILNNKLIRSGKNIIIADYGQSYAREVGNWMTKIAKDIAIGKNACRNKILIVDREQNDKRATLFTALTEEDYNGRLKGYQWKEDFISIKPLQKDSIKRILRSYIEYRTKDIDDNAVENLFMTLEKIDPDLRRPLYAMFIADAYCDNEDPSHWDRERVLNWVTEREDKLIKKRIEEYGVRLNDKQQKAIEAIRFIATINGDISIDEIKENYQKQWDTYKMLFEHTPIDLEQCLRSSGIQEEDTIKAIRPDVIGEYYVLRRFERYKELFLLNGWTENNDILSFLDRLTGDYSEPNEVFRELFEMLYEYPPTLEIAIHLYAIDICLINSKNGGDIDQSSRTVLLLKDLYEQRPHEDDPFLAISYAFSLFMLCFCRQPLEGLTENSYRLKELSEKYYKSTIKEQFAYYYAFSLYRLCCNQPPEKAQESLKLLKELSERNRGNKMISDLFWKAYFNS